MPRSHHKPFPVRDGGNGGDDGCDEPFDLIIRWLAGLLCGREEVAAADERKREGVEVSGGRNSAEVALGREVGGDRSRGLTENGDSASWSGLPKPSPEPVTERLLERPFGAPHA